MKMLSIIGNGIVSKDISKTVDSSDAVVRFNNLDNYNLNTGTKTSIWVLSSNKIILGNLIQNHKTITEKTNQTLTDSFLLSKKILFSIPTFFPFKNKFEMEKYRTERYESVKEFWRQLGLSEMSYDIVEFPKKFLLDLKPEKWLMKYQCPSNGYLITRFLRESPEYSDYKIKLAGFSWEGWEGHPWEFEKEYLMRMQNKELIEIIE